MNSLILVAWLAVSMPLSQDTSSNDTRQIALGDAHSCSIDLNDRILCWGDNSAGQLAVRDPILSQVPQQVQIPGAGRPIFLTAGARHTCALAIGGLAYCWGDNERGQLGNRTSGSRSAPTAVAGDLRFKALAAGKEHTCGVTTEGAVFCWGRGGDGQLGIGDPKEHCPNSVCSEPVEVTVSEPAESIIAGDDHTCIIDMTRAAFCWGNGKFGRLGTGDVNKRLIPARVTGGLRFQMLAAGSDHTCGITTDGAAVCWGGGHYGQLGDDKSGLAHVQRAPTPVMTTLRLRMISARSLYTCAISIDNGLFCWGENKHRRFGQAIGSQTEFKRPIQVAAGIRAAVLGANHACAEPISKGELYCYGKNDRSQAGVPPAAEMRPVKVAGVQLGEAVAQDRPRGANPQRQREATQSSATNETTTLLPVRDFELRLLSFVSEARSIIREEPPVQGAYEPQQEYGQRFAAWANAKRAKLEQFYDTHSQHIAFRMPLKAAYNPNSELLEFHLEPALVRIPSYYDHTDQLLPGSYCFGRDFITCESSITPSLSSYWLRINGFEQVTGKLNARVPVPLGRARALDVAFKQVDYQFTFLLGASAPCSKPLGPPALGVKRPAFDWERVPAITLLSIEALVGNELAGRMAFDDHLGRSSAIIDGHYCDVREISNSVALTHMTRSR